MEKKSDNNQSLTRGIRLMEFLSDYPNGCSLAYISERTGINKSTTHRLLKRLQQLGYITPTATLGSYRLTTKSIAMGSGNYASRDVIRVASPHMDQLNMDTGETVNLSVREGNHVILIHKIDPTAGGLRTRAYVGERSPMYSSARGKVFLAFSEPGFVDKYWESEQSSFTRFTSHTIVARGGMEHELLRIREERIGYDREEGELGAFCIAAPIFNLQGRVDYALSLSLSAARLNESQKIALAEQTRDTAEGITQDYIATLGNAAAE